MPCGAASALGANRRNCPVSSFKVEPHAFAFKTGVDADRLSQLVDEFEAEEFSRKLER